MAGIVSFYSFQPLSPGVMDIGMCALHQPPNASNSGATDDAKETETLFHQMNDFSEQFSTAHNFKCSLYSEGKSSRLCGARSITIELKKTEDGVTSKSEERYEEVVFSAS